MILVTLAGNREHLTEGRSSDPNLPPIVDGVPMLRLVRGSPVRRL